MEDLEIRNRVDSACLVAILDTAVDGIITIDLDGNILSFNTAAQKIFGYPNQDIIGSKIESIITISNHGLGEEGINWDRRSAISDILAVGSREVIGKRKNDEYFAMDLGVGEVKLDGEHFYVAIVRDISERKRQEMERDRLIAALCRSNQELDEFAYIASHDLKEPLRGLFNNAMFLSEDYAAQFDEGGKKRLKRMTFLCQKMEKLIDELLYYSRIGRQEMAIKRTNINAIIEEICLMIEVTIKEKNVDLIIAEELPEITCDRLRITEVFRNLITNAIKYNDKPQKTIEIGYIPEFGDKRDVFFVKDNGIGIAPEFYTDIFKIFKRLNEENDEVKGTGVGLTFVKKILERHGGDIWLESELNLGTTFYFTLNGVIHDKTSKQAKDNTTG